MKCNMDCFNCPYPDCINDDPDAERKAAHNKANKKYRDSVKGKAKEKEQNRKYYQQHREEIIARIIRNRAKVAQC